MNAINKNEVSMFKVGDKVLGLNAWISLYVQEVTDVYEGYVVLDTGSKCKDSALRHATPEEIAAGHRIDLETLRDCDTSPNCKKFDERVK